MNTLLKPIALNVARYSGGFSIYRYKTRTNLRILAYHGVEDVGGLINADGFQVHPSVFQAQLEHIARYYRVVSQRDVIDAIRGGEELSDKAVLITFDDGYLNNLKYAAEALKKQGFPAVFFVTTGFIDRTHVPWWYVLREWIAEVGSTAVGMPPGMDTRQSASGLPCLFVWENHLKGMTAEARNQAMLELGRKIERPLATTIQFMNWDHIRSLASMGFDVAPHTVSHINLGREPESMIVDEIDTSVHRLLDELKYVPESYSYPYGRAEDIQPGVLSALRKWNISLGVTTVPGMNRRNVDPLLMKRLNVTGNHRGLAFEKLLAMG